MGCECNWNLDHYLEFLRQQNAYSGIAVAGDSGSGKTTSSRECRLSNLGRRLVTHIELDQWVPAHPICSISPYPKLAMVDLGVRSALEIGRVPILDFASIDDDLFQDVIKSYRLKLIVLPDDLPLFCPTLEKIMVSAITYRAHLLNCTACKVNYE